MLPVHANAVVWLVHLPGSRKHLVEEEGLKIYDTNWSYGLLCGSGPHLSNWGVWTERKEEIPTNHRTRCGSAPSLLQRYDSVWIKNVQLAFWSIEWLLKAFRKYVQVGKGHWHKRGCAQGESLMKHYAASFLVLRIAPRLRDSESVFCRSISSLQASHVNPVI